MTPEEIGKILGSDIPKKLYDDALSKPSSEIGNLLGDFVKAVRLFTAPIQLLASYQERLQKYLKEVSDRVPKEKQIVAEAAYAGAIIERLAYVGEDHYLKKHYLNLLEKAINKDTVGLAHPAFPSIVHQLSPDETLIMEKLRNESIVMSFEYERDLADKIINEEIVDTNFDVALLSFPELRGMYADHLQFLNLIRIQRPESETYIPSRHKLRRTHKYELSDFGRLFVMACV